MNPWAETRLKNNLFRAIIEVERYKVELKVAQAEYDKLYKEVQRRATWNVKRRKTRKK